MNNRITDDSLDSAEFDELKRKSLAGIGALFVRQVLIKVIFFVGNIVLARMLAPQVFGIYAIVSFVVQFFSTFSDVGIGAALIQKRGELTREELSTTFWLQQLLVWLVVGVVIAAAPLALKVYPTLPPVGVWLIRAMAVSFLFSSLKTIPAILMERDIDFKKIAWVDITENLVFQTVAISCAFMGFEAWSFILAAIARALLGAVIIYALSPWRPTFHYRFEEVKGVVRFGVPYQGNHILSFVKDAVTPLFVGVYAGAAAVGYVNWARNFAFAPLMISEAFGRVAFPAFSKLQGEKELLARATERSIRMMTMIMFPIMAAMIAMGSELIHLIFTDKWMPGIYAYYCFCMSPVAIGISLPLYSSILALGRSNILLVMTACLVIVEWSLGVVFVLLHGFIGVAMTQLVVVPVFTLVYVLVLKKYGINVKVLKNFLPQLLIAVMATVVIMSVKGFFDTNLVSLVFMVLLCTTVYFVLGYFACKRDFFEAFDYFKKVCRG